MMKIKKKIKKKMNNMKKLKKFESFLNDSVPSSSFDEMSELLTRANILICNHRGLNPEECDEVTDVDSAIDGLTEVGTDEAISLKAEIADKDDEIYAFVGS